MAIEYYNEKNCIILGYDNDLRLIIPITSIKKKKLKTLTGLYRVTSYSCFSSVQFSSFTQSCLILCNPMNCSMPGLPVHHQLLEFTQTQVHPAISSSVVRFSSCPRSLPASGSFPMSQFFASGGASVEASISVLPMNIQG